jgi:FlaA1/EpsC-like NDP-sugar epimerase
MTWLRTRALALLDGLLIFAALLVSHRLVTGAWLLVPLSGRGLAALFVTGAYIGALYLGGAYRPSSIRPLSSNLVSTGSYLLGTCSLLLVVSSLILSVLSPFWNTLAAHGLLSFTSALGYRVLLIQLSSSFSPSISTMRTPPSVNLGDLVPRPSVEIDQSALRNTLSDQTVLVTGAGGSIGSELSAQLLALDPFRLVLVDVSEHNLYQLEASLRSHDYDGELEFCIADVRDEAVMDGLMAREQPDLVLHTAAYKHVPLLERHPAEAFRNNTMATVHLLRLCERHGVEQFVFVSTDKAVHPTSVLGATKQRAEWYVRTAPASMRSATVRFGNVFGSQGSVVPRFEQKLAVGEPLPVTHPGMERYFMTSGEACRLLLQTLLLDSHPTYILRMGDPMRIQWLAEQLIEQWYPDADPASMIEYVGRRPGEKLSEDLVQETESVHSTIHPSILGLDAPAPYSRETLRAHFQHLQSLCDPVQGSREQLRDLLLDAQPAVSPSPS